MSEAKTLEALDKIRAICVEYDLWGVLGACDNERMHWMFQLEPSWSCLTFDQTTGKVHIKAKRADFATDAGHKLVIGATGGAAHSTRDFGALLFQQMDTVIKIMRDAGVEFKHESYKDIRYGVPKKS